jgi:26S proteasome regulatory subunit N13
MYSDLFDQLGSRPSRLEPSAPPEQRPLVSFKAGKLDLESTDSGAYQCKARTTRGEVRLMWKENALTWQWYDRRDKKVLDTCVVPTEGNSRLERVPLADKQHKDDRIYVWTKNSGEYEMYWMQDADPSLDEEIMEKVNGYLKDPKSAAPAQDATPNTNTATANGRASSSSSQAQVDALSSILENLGMPQAATGSSPDGTAANTNSNSNSGGTLTLADLQGAMAGVNQRQERPPSLSEVVTPSSITALLEDETVCNRLMELLPPDQRDREHLESNLRSPQVQQTLRSLTAAIMPDDTGSMDGFYSVIANFSLDPADGHEAIAANQPIQAFLDCVLKSVEKEKEEETGEDSKEEEMKED